MYIYEFSFFAIGVLNEDFRAEADSLLFDLMELGVLLFKGGGGGVKALLQSESDIVFEQSMVFYSLFFCSGV